VRILAIETSCDDTSVSIVRDGQWVESLVVSSQIKAHQRFGGVVPELAARMHTETVHYLLPKCLAEAGRTWSEIDAIAVTTNPGLEGSLIIGVTVAKTLAMTLNKPIIPVNHITGHICSIFLDNPKPIVFPLVALVVSGGHTQLWTGNTIQTVKLLSETRDDAAGEAFDKVARLLGLPYPGGPTIESRAKLGQPTRFKLPEPLRHSPLEFSFSGLKTAVANCIQQQSPLTESDINDICAAFQQTVISTLLRKVTVAVNHSQAATVAIVGGVAANRTLLHNATEIFSSINVMAPPIKYCTDNAAMIAAAAHFCGSQVPLNTIRVGCAC